MCSFSCLFHSSMFLRFSLPHPFSLCVILSFHPFHLSYFLLEDSFFALLYHSFFLPHSNLHSFSLSFSLFTTSSLPTIHLILFLFPCLFIYTRKLRNIDRSDEILFSLEIRKCDRLFARRPLQ